MYYNLMETGSVGFVTSSVIWSQSIRSSNWSTRIRVKYIYIKTNSNSPDKVICNYILNS